MHGQKYLTTFKKYWTHSKFFELADRLGINLDSFNDKQPQKKSKRNELFYKSSFNILNNLPEQIKYSNKEMDQNWFLLLFW